VIDTDVPLDEVDLDPDPITEFNRWLRLAEEVGEPQPNAMGLATVTPEGEPAARMVLLHRADRHGFLFFTNYESAKARDLGSTPRAALVFYWPRLHRQVRAHGPVSQASRKESEAYWAQRPYGNRVAAFASPQSRVIPSRSVLEEEVRRVERRYPEGPPLPAFWGGYRVAPEVVEFWQGRRHRLHDRLRYVRSRNGWRIERLAP